MHRCRERDSSYKISCVQLVQYGTMKRENAKSVSEVT